VTTVAVRWYLRYSLSYRKVAELLAERGIIVDHVTVYRWVQRFPAEFIEAARPCRRHARRLRRGGGLGRRRRSGGHHFQIVENHWKANSWVIYVRGTSS
jgi:transposase